MPALHTFKEAWKFRLYFRSGLIAEFSSDCVHLAGGKEVGVLQAYVGFVADEYFRQYDNLDIFQTVPVDDWKVLVASLLIFEDESVRAECGIVLHGDDLETIKIAAGVPPGSVSVDAPFSTGEYWPEFLEPQYSLTGIEIAGQPPE